MLHSRERTGTTKTGGRSSLSGAGSISNGRCEVHGRPGTRSGRRRPAHDPGDLLGGVKPPAARIPGGSSEPCVCLQQARRRPMTTLPTRAPGTRQAAVSTRPTAIACRVRPGSREVDAARASEAPAAHEPVRTRCRSYQDAHRSLYTGQVNGDRPAGREIGDGECSVGRRGSRHVVARVDVAVGCGRPVAGRHERVLLVGIDYPASTATD